MYDIYNKNKSAGDHVATKAVMDEIKRSKDVIIFIDELHTLVGAGAAEGAIDASNILKPASSS